MSISISKFKRFLKTLRIHMLLKTRYRLISCGTEFYCGYRTHIRPNCLSVGDYVFIGNDCHIASQAYLGNFVMLASRVSIVGGDHRTDVVGLPATLSGRDVNKPVQIGDDVWIGHGAIIMHGVTIGNGAVVAAGAIITSNVAPYAIVGGIPAKPIRQRFDTSAILYHELMLKNYRETGALPNLRNLE